MKLILNVTDPQDYSPALNAAMMVMQSNPDQKVGTTLMINQGGQRFGVVRNQDSYTVEYA